MGKYALVLATVALLAGGSASPAQAPDTSRALALRVLEAMQMERTVEEQYAVIRQSQVQMMGQFARNEGSSPERVQRLETMQKELMDLLQEELSWKKTKDAFAVAYASTFSDHELRGLIEFYESPIGRVLVAKTPALAQRVMAISQGRVRDVLPRIQELMRKHAQAGRGADTDDRP